MKQFILNRDPDKNGRVRLEGGDYRYLIRVRRLAPGEYFPALLPDGVEVMVRICSVDNKTVVGEILHGENPHNENHQPGSPLPPIILFQAMPKGEKMDLIVRQAAEGGLAEIVPFVSEFSAVKIEKSGGQKFSRWERIIKEARQQSGSATATIIRQPLSIDGLFAYWEQITTRQPGALGLLFHHLPLAKMSLHGYLNSSPEAVVLTIGPEGGFSSAEAERFLAAGFKPFTVGDTILRTETAALYAHAAVRILLWEKDLWEMK
ncbi:MAG: 16S rRNA (uracil(1498)-N(3))-methyltransferase [Treponema sp.]|jgi:16S rRNA (uracil1498-N3)-methyltransferase|nr:16S rRNA (uracil(1498)-N(3))-methyltransferase [Treponema sp.]